MAVVSGCAHHRLLVVSAFVTRADDYSTGSPDDSLCCLLFSSCAHFSDTERVSSIAGNATDAPSRFLGLEDLRREGSEEKDNVMNTATTNIARTKPLLLLVEKGKRAHLLLPGPQEAAIYSYFR